MPPAPSQYHGPVEDLVAHFEGEGFEVVERTPGEVAMVRHNPWSSHILGVLVGAIGGALNPSPRRQRLWLHVDTDGQAVVRHYSRPPLRAHPHLVGGRNVARTIPTVGYGHRIA
ncbi:MAG: hypothetical protein M0R75_04190 [Dehalococcoidia bacterium]|nr:hypothetical protein [Dehalococcoidia bacterium]